MQKINNIIKLFDKLYLESQEVEWLDSKLESIGCDYVIKNSIGLIYTNTEEVIEILFDKNNKISYYIINGIKKKITNGEVLIVKARKNTP